MAREDAPFVGGMIEGDALGGAVPGAMLPAKKKSLSVSGAVRLAKSILQEHTFHIEGEVSELSDKPGYKAVYFTIKDEDASLPCLMWKSRYQSSGVVLRIGAKVEVTGKFTIFAPKGRMNFDVSKLVLAGDGDLRQRVAQLAEKLRREGLMDASRKRALPAYPQTIGLVTSPRGAAVHDVLRTLRRRYPQARIAFAGVPVEGAQAPQNLTAALNTVATSGAEVVLLVRGGGSFEDLMPFNDEGLARAIAACPVPVVTGIGHEPDTSIADMVADLRASTPTAAAEAASPHVDELRESIDALSARMTGSLTHRIHRSVVYVDGIASRPLFKDPTSLFAAEAQMVDVCQDRIERAAAALLPARSVQVDALKARLDVALPHVIETAQADIARASRSLKATGATLLGQPTHQTALAQGSLSRIGQTLTVPFQSQAAVVTARLNDLSPLHILERGWSIVTTEEGGVLRSVDSARPNDKVKVQLADGALACRVEGVASSDLANLINVEDQDD